MSDQKHDFWAWAPDFAPIRTERAEKSRRIGAWGAVAAASLAVAGLAALNRALANQAEEAHPPRGHFLTVRGQRLHYLDDGEGPVVVLLHGNGSMAEDFVCGGLLKRLSENFRVIAFDRPGFGHSPPRKNSSPKAQADLIADALARLGVTEATILGHSWGTLVAAAMAGGPKVHVGGLILVSGYYLSSRRPELLLGSVAAVPIVGELLAHTVLPWLARANWPAVIRKLFAPQPASSFDQFPADLTFRPSQLQASAKETALLNASIQGLSKRLRALDLPIVAIAGTDDKVVDPVHSSAFARRVPNIRLEIIPDQGHMVHHTAADQIMNAIISMQRESTQQEHHDVDRG